MIRPTGTIFTRQDGDVWRILDGEDRRYTIEGHWEAELGYMTPDDHALWDRLTAFGEREARHLVAALQREQRAAAALDRIAAGLLAFGDALTAAKEWRSRRGDGQ